MTGKKRAAQKPDEIIFHPESQYQSYLLRLWRAEEGKACRVMLEQVGSHEHHRFANLEDLCTFLHRQMDSTPEKRE